MRRALRDDKRYAYQARILKAGIEDDKRNFTRFFLIQKKPRFCRGPTRLRLPST